MKEGRKGGSEEGGRAGREGRKSSNERDIADLDLEVYKLIFFERRKEKKISKGEEERGRERARVNGNIALF